MHLCIVTHALAVSSEALLISREHRREFFSDMVFFWGPKKVRTLAKKSVIAPNPREATMPKRATEYTLDKTSHHTMHRPKRLSSTAAVATLLMLPDDLFSVVARKCSATTLLLLSHTNKGLGTAVANASEVLLWEMADASTTMEARLVGCTTLCRLARLAGRTVSVPQETLKPLSETFWLMATDNTTFAFMPVDWTVQPEANDLLYLAGILNNDAVAKEVAAIIEQLVIYRDIREWNTKDTHRLFAPRLFIDVGLVEKAIALMSAIFHGATPSDARELKAKTKAELNANSRYDSHDWVLILS